MQIGAVGGQYGHSPMVTTNNTLPLDNDAGENGPLGRRLFSVKTAKSELVQALETKISTMKSDLRSLTPNTPAYDKLNYQILDLKDLLKPVNDCTDDSLNNPMIQDLDVAEFVNAVVSALDKMLSYQIDDMSGFQTGIAGKEVKNVVRIYPFGAKKPTDCQLHWNDASQSQTDMKWDSNSYDDENLKKLWKDAISALSFPNSGSATSEDDFVQEMQYDYRIPTIDVTLKLQSGQFVKLNQFATDEGKISVEFGTPFGGTGTGSPPPGTPSQTPSGAPMFAPDEAMANRLEARFVFVTALGLAVSFVMWLKQLK